MKYRKKPVTIEAWLTKDLVDGYFGLEPPLPREIVQAIDDGLLTMALNGIYVRTLEGGMFSRMEDMLIMGIQGEFYPCKADIFAATYEEV